MLQCKIDIATKDKKARAGAIEYDELLFEQLRTLRRRLTDDCDVPPCVLLLFVQELTARIRSPKESLVRFFPMCRSAKWCEIIRPRRASSAAFPASANKS